MNRHFWGFCLSLLVLSGCIDRYTPEVAPTDQTNLVVDGFINPRGRTLVKLARTFRVNTQPTPPTETGAQVTIQDDAGRRYPLTESPAGTYTSAPHTLDAARRYQLRITTAQGREYASDLAPVLLTPPIDTLTWQLTPVGGIQTYLSTRNPDPASRFYRWEYEETHQFTSAYQSALEYQASTNAIGSRPNERQIFTCWRTEPSTAILQGTTSQLSQNALLDYPLLTVLPSVKLKLGYSLLVRQLAQTQAEYSYWETLRKNTENLGTVNDPLPARVTGNVHALADPAEAVLGYVGVHSVTEKRLFVGGNQFPTPRPASVFYDPAYATCPPLEIASATAFYLRQMRDGLLIPTTYVPMSEQRLFYVSTPSCVDCRLRGTSEKPSFWP
jgi:hypothetical protein